MTDVIVFVLVGLVVLAAAGCGCVFWAARGGPGWVRKVAAVTLTAGELVRVSGRRSGTSRGGSGGELDGGSGD